MALIGGKAPNGPAPHAHAEFASIGAGARVPVIAGRSRGASRMGTGARARIADTRRMALVQGTANNLLHTLAHSANALVFRSALVGVAARAAVGARGAGANPGAGITGPGLMTVVARKALHGIPSDAGSIVATVLARAPIAVIAGAPGNG